MVRGCSNQETKNKNFDLKWKRQIFELANEQKKTFVDEQCVPIKDKKIAKIFSEDAQVALTREKLAQEQLKSRPKVLKYCPKYSISLNLVILVSH